MEQDRQELQILLVIGRQEIREGFKRVIVLPDGDQVTLLASSRTVSNDKSTSGEAENQHSKNDELTSAAPIHVEAVSISSSKEQEKIPSTSNSKSEKKTVGQITSTRFETYFEAAFVGGLIGTLVVGLGLYVFGRLPTSLAISASAIAALLTLIVSCWDIIIKRFFRPLVRRWQYPTSFISLAVGFVVITGTFLVWTVGGDDPYYRLASPTFFDSLKDGQNNNYWTVGTFPNDTKSSCDFKEGSYIVDTSQQHNITWCTASSTDFDNFVYEVKMRIIEGDCGGIVFRADVTHDKYYLFEFCLNKTYNLWRYDKPTYADLLISGTDNYMKSFPSGTKEITLAIGMRGTNFELYIDQHLVDKAFDVSNQALKQGAIGVAVDNLSKETKVAFNDAQVWKF